jgi:hypothetical protein
MFAVLLLSEGVALGYNIKPFQGWHASNSTKWKNIIAKGNALGNRETKI